MEPNSLRPEKIDLQEMLDQYDLLYGQLSALKHIVYSSLSLSDPEHLAAIVLQQIKKCYTGRENAIWIRDPQGQFVQTAVNGELLPPDQRFRISSDTAEFPKELLSGRMKVFNLSFADTSFFSDFDRASFFPFTSGGSVNGFLVVDQVSAAERDFFQFVSHFAGIILNISRLHHEVVRQQHELGEMIDLLMLQNEQMSALHHVGIQIAIAPDPITICRLTTDTLVMELGAWKAAAFLLEGAAQELRWVSTAGDVTDIGGSRLQLAHLEPIRHALESGRIITRSDYPFDLDLGTNRLVDWAIYPLKSSGRAVGAVIAESKDASINDQAAILINHASIVIDTLMILDKVSEEREQLADTLGSIGDGVITTDLQGRITMMNQVARRLTGWHSQDPRGQLLDTVFFIVDEQERKPVQNTLQSALQSDRPEEPAYPVLLQALGGDEHPIVMSGTPIKDSQGRRIGSVLIFKDITALRRSEQESLKLQKLESLGVMAGGLAHDFNNLLSVILGNINIAQLRLQPDDPAAKSLQRAEEAICRAEDLTKRFITFSSGGAPVKSKTDIVDLIRDVAHLTVSGSNVKCEFDFSDHLLPVSVDLGQMRQVFCNVLENAKQAMPEGGIVRIGAENVVAGNRRTASDPQIPAGEYIRIHVIDHGVGIEEENLSKIFDPYYSSQKRGAEKGMGMGLAVAHTVIRRHGGDIRASSKPGSGTSIYIYLPSAGDGSANLSVADSLDFSRRPRRVMVMDDEALIRDLAVQLLETLGIEAATAEDGVEAVSMYSEAMKSGNPFTAVILDLTVPAGMGGEKAVQELLRLDPDVRAIVSSGYAGDPIMAAYQDYGFIESLPKPYNIKQFTRIFQKILP